MDELLASSELAQLKSGDVLDGTVMNIKKHELWVDLGVYGVGVVQRREMGQGAMEIGQSITVSIVESDVDGLGHAQLSMRKAAKDKGWDELQRVQEAGEIIEVMPADTNSVDA